MKRFKSLSLKKKRVLAVAGVAILCFSVVGTIAYNQNSTFFNNLFGLAADTMEFVETFDSPDDWQPCQEIPKTAIARNKNNEPRYVRMKINEYWRTKNTQTPATDHETSDLPLTWDDNGTTKHYAVINTQNDDKWELKSDGWYYYKTTLAKDEETLSLLKSVTLNCEVNTVGEIRYSAGGLVSESIPTDYAEANYHLYITFQMSDEDMTPKPLLYDTIADLSTGLDTNLNFNSAATVNDKVYTMADHANDEYPVHYYRGKYTVNNHVIFADRCWRIIRTTELGGTRMLYDGMANNGTCRSSLNANDGLTIESAWANPARGGYMESSKPDYELATQVAIDNKWTGSFDAGFTFGKNVVYENGAYRLTDLYVVHHESVNDSGYARWNAQYGTIASEYRYTCGSNVTSCSKVYYMLTASTAITADYVAFVNGDTVETLKEDLHANEKNSRFKNAIDAWYQNNIASYENYLEDSVYCGERTPYAGPLKGSDSIPLTILSTDYQAYARLELDANNIHPSVDCTLKSDSFTVSNSAGNQALTYPVAMMTADEAVLAGNNVERSYLRMNRQSVLTMTVRSSTTTVMLYASSDNKIKTSYTQYATRPVISLVHNTFVDGGDGSYNNPYILSW